MSEENIIPAKKWRGMEIDEILISIDIGSRVLKEKIMRTPDPLPYRDKEYILETADYLINILKGKLMAEESVKNE